MGCSSWFFSSSRSLRRGRSLVVVLSHLVVVLVGCVVLKVVLVNKEFKQYHINSLGRLMISSTLQPLYHVYTCYYTCLSCYHVYTATGVGFHQLSN